MLSPAVSSLSLRDLEYAVAVDRERHFGRAARACGVSQAGLSEQVRKLETILGVVLFERTKRRVEPTARGAAILRRAERLLEDARALLDEARRSAEPLSGELRLGVIATLGPYYMPSVIALGRRRFPRLALRLHESTTHDLLDALRGGKLDAIVVALPIPLDGVVAERLFFERFRLACPSDHALARRERIALHELEHAPLLLMSEGHCLRDHLLSLCDARRLPHRSRHASSLEMLRHMIAAGEGISLIPQLAAAEHATIRGLIAYRDLEDPRAGRTIAFVRRATETRAEEMRAIASFLRDEPPAGVVVDEKISGGRRERSSVPGHSTAQEGA